MLFNNKNYLEYNPVDIRRNISYCTQTPYLFGKDVYENLCFPCSEDKFYGSWMMDELNI